MPRVKFLGCCIDNYSTEEILDKLASFIKEGGPHQLVAVNAAKIVKMQHDEKLSEVVNSCDIIFADGQSVVWASKILGCPLKERVAGIDLMQAIVERAQEEKYSLYFLGAKHEIVEKTVAIYKKIFPGIKIVGRHDGYFSSRSDEKKIINEIKDISPDILFVAMGTPMKEFWIRENLVSMGVRVCLGVGGSFDVIAGTTKRAPQWVQKAGLEWFFRFLNEPGRLWKRYLVTNSAYIWLVIKEKFRW